MTIIENPFAINYWAVLVCGIIAMGVGALWYGPLFGKLWLHVVNATSTDLEARKKMQKSAGPLYLIQFLIALFQVGILAYTMQVVTMTSPPLPLVNRSTFAFWIWAAFIIPTLAGSAMWNNNPGKIKWTQFLLQAGYQAVCFIIFSIILDGWV